MSSKSIQTTATTISCSILKMAMKVLESLVLLPVLTTPNQSEAIPKQFFGSTDRGKVQSMNQRKQPC
jgi:hypothetical protein